MPFWCGYWGSFWWVFPLIGLVMMGVMIFACVRGAGCMGWWAARRGVERQGGAADEFTALRREVQALREEVSRSARNPPQGG